MMSPSLLFAHKVPVSDDQSVLPSMAEPHALGRRLRTHRIGRIHPLQNLSIADRHIGIGRRVRNAVIGEAVAHAQEIRFHSEAGFWSLGPALFNRVRHFSKGTLGNAPDRIRFVETVMRRLGQLSQFPEGCRNAKRNRMIDRILRG